jgi:UDP-N-acetylglucosamine transferase subunit ALG13
VSTFVSVGNATQPFARLLDGVAAIASALPQPIFVQSGSTRFQAGGCTSVPYLAMSEFERCVRRSTLSIMHAGAGSVITAVRAGRVPVVMPRRARLGEVVDDHQEEFARELGAAGRIVIAADPGDLLSAAHEALARQASVRSLSDAPRMVTMVAEALHRHAIR